MAKSGSLKKKPVGKKAPTEPIAKQDILIDKMIEASSYAKVEGKPRTLPISADVPFDPGDYRNKGGPMKVLAQVAESTSMLAAAYHTHLYLILSYVYGVAVYLAGSEEAWLDFIADPSWLPVKGRPNPEDRTFPLQCVLRAALGLQAEGSAKTASKYCAALSDAFRRKLPAEDIVGYLEAGGGIEKLAKREAQRRRNAPELLHEPALRLTMPLDAVAQRLLGLKEGVRQKLTIRVVKSNGTDTLDIKVEKIKAIPAASAARK
ncbi:MULTISPECIES: hypothetical protein [unclassified Devosia]|uniref:hypothetical protein n=1 Tax=unclassified Devosia TaxID=196773 RepID=UPI00086CD27E|nr:MULTISPECIES: hypothetical protein [unclassified Devosia]MBN9360836.1 hypothetical protein [Devosia sp.]ODS88185.1 MAG: hypothetical protein ABS47_10550 [Devosia sp. SCN 66-27]OJX22788.1 MAG: hypothetical protein BGO83_18605 [Devosia sp. 66-14]